MTLVKSEAIQPTNVQKIASLVEAWNAAKADIKDMSVTMVTIGGRNFIT